MKKTICLGLAAAMLFATACSHQEQKEELDTTAVVSFSVGLDSKMGTRAISDGKGIDQIMYAVFNEDGSELLVSKVTIDDAASMIAMNSTNGGYVDITLPKGQTYKVVFWAQNSECDAYTVSDDMKVTVDYTGLNNDETRDAYYHATMPFKLDRHLSKEVVLKRPFAQVNVGTYESELEYVKEYGAEVTHSAATIKGVANQINLIDGTVSGNVDVAYSASVMPSEKLFVDVDKDDMKEAYEYMSMCYVLAGDKNSVHEVSFEFSDASGQTVATAASVDLISLLRNWRTNILGYFFTGNANLDIVIDAEYENDYNVITSNKDIYYNVTEDTVFENSTYIMSNYNVGLWFASENGQLITANNIRIYGSVWTVSFGEYRGAKYYNYNNLLNNVVCKDLVVSNVIKDHDVYVSVGTQIYGKSTLNNCKMTGTTTVATVHFDGTPHDYTPVDIGIPNECDAVLNDCEVGSMYLWTHAVVTLNNTTVDRIICSCCNSTKHSNLTVAAGSTVGVIDCTQPAKYGSRLIIEEGATVGELNLVNASFKDMDIRGTVNKITYQGVEYTLDELKALGL
jgi:hypothetical protein